MKRFTVVILVSLTNICVQPCRDAIPRIRLKTVRNLKDDQYFVHGVIE